MAEIKDPENTIILTLKDGEVVIELLADVGVVLVPADVAEHVGRDQERADELAREYLARMVTEARFSQRFEPCVAALEKHIETASAKIARLG